jgi:hypothetical protein
LLKSNTILWVLSLTFLVVSTAFAADLDPDKFMSVDQIETGMKGIGKTVFEGTRIDEFQIEVIDIVRNRRSPLGDIIWVLCSGGPIDESGVMQGMSGSPVYIDGKLIGAVAYTYQFTKRPIAGVTTIASMLELMGNKMDAKSSMLHKSMLASPYPGSGGQDFSISAIPIQMPVMMSGFHPRAIDSMASTLKNFGMVPVQGGGTSPSTKTDNIEIKPGAVIGVQFVRGDASAFASGTLTYVDGDKILAFGHPMYGMGEVNIPICVGRVGHLVSSMVISSKHASPLRTIGTLTYDSQYGIMGVVGKEPDFIPMKVRIRTDRFSQPREYNFEIAKHKIFSPVYIRSMAESVIYSAGKSMGDYTMTVHSEIEVKGHPTISKDNIFSGTSPGAVADAFAAPVYALMRNTFEVADIKSVFLEIEFDDKIASADIDGVRINRDEIRPGDSLEVTVFLVPYFEDIIIKEFQITIPKDMPEGRALLRISDAESTESWEKARAPMKSEVKDMAYLVQRIQEEESNNDIIVELFAPKVGVTIGDKELPALPLTTFSVMSSQKQKGASAFTRGTTFLKQRISTDFMISGNVGMFLNIDRDASY